jgi:WXXGXW repeat (2 copies)
MRIIPSVRCLLFAVVVLSLAVLTLPAPAVAQIGISVSFGPPALPVYEQPVCPGDGYIWTPGYWAYADDYYWVPGTWVLAPEVGFLWTPGWWGWGGSAFLFHEGYWGPHVGFYGGINYGFGYFGDGFEGGRWDNGHFFYNRSVNNVNVTVVHNVYNTTVIHNTTVNRVSYNGGNGGVEARPTPEQERFSNERHIEPVAVQKQHMEAARNDPQQRASENHGKPAVAATARPGEFKGGAVPAREAGAPYNPPANRGGAETHGNEPVARPENNVPRPAEGNNVPRPTAPNDARDLQSHPRPAAPNTGNAKLDQKYQQQQEKLAAQQEKDHQKLAAQQEKQHQQAAKQNADEGRKQQMEQQHQQQTQQMEERHVQQQQHMQERQQPRASEARPK